MSLWVKESLVALTSLPRPLAADQSCEVTRPRPLHRASLSLRFRLSGHMPYKTANRMIDLDSLMSLLHGKPIKERPR